jgi:hypothetical protein
MPQRAFPALIRGGQSVTVKNRQQLRWILPRLVVNKINKTTQWILSGR